MKAEFNIVRVTGVPMELRSCLADFDAATGKYTLYAGSGGAVRQKIELVQVLGIAPDKLRVLSYDVGGNFGTRNRPFVEFGLVLWAAGKLKRPVKYTATRSEAFLTDYQGRDLVTKVELAFDNERPHPGDARRQHQQRRRALRVAVAAVEGLGPDHRQLRHSGGDACASRAVFTNTMPTNAYRSSGRPEVTFAIERLMDMAADQLGIDRVRLRRKNFVKPKAMPYRNAVGMLYDSGTYEANMDLAMKIADVEGFKQRKREAKKRGRLLGLGIAPYVESSIGSPKERTEITVKPNGVVDVVIGTQPSGQGHETSFAQVVADLIAVPHAVHQHHHRRHRHRQRRRRLAFRPLDAPRRHGDRQGRARADRQGQEGRGAGARTRRWTRSSSRTAGSRRRPATAASISWSWPRRPRGSTLPPELKDGLAIAADNEMHDPVFPNGCAVCEVEIDPDTGAARPHPLRRGRRRRPLHQSDDRPRPDAWRHRAGRGAGAVGAVLR